MSKIKPVRGMNDITPREIRSWQIIESSIRKVFSSYGYEEIRFPIVEKVSLFNRSIGESTDIVTKEMYTFEDKKGEEIALRPEGTASCVRAAISNNLLRTDSPRLWYMGPMFRYERPQKGRSRQFHQASLEAYGISDPYMEAELLVVSSRLWKDLGGENDISLEVNTLGNENTRKKYKEALLDFFRPYTKDLDEDSLKNLRKNPLRIMDSKSNKVKKFSLEAPKIIDFLDDESRDHFDELLHMLDDLKLPYIVNPKLVRGLDYYNKTVFEWKTDKIGAQDTVCAGGRYDTLVQDLGGKPCPGVGFSIGMERLVLLLQDDKKEKLDDLTKLHVFFICLTRESIPMAILYVEEIREKIPNLNIKINFGLESASSQFKRADNSGAEIALILGEEELNKKKISVKALRNELPQKAYNLMEVIRKLQDI